MCLLAGVKILLELVAKGSWNFVVKLGVSIQIATYSRLH